MVISEIGNFGVWNQATLPFLLVIPNCTLNHLTATKQKWGTSCIFPYFCIICRIFRWTAVVIADGTGGGFVSAYGFIADSIWVHNFFFLFFETSNLCQKTTENGSFTYFFKPFIQAIALCTASMWCPLLF